MVPYPVLPTGHLHFLARFVVARVRHAPNDDAVREIKGLVHHESPLLGRVWTSSRQDECTCNHPCHVPRSHLSPPFTSDSLLASLITASSVSFAYLCVVTMLAWPSTCCS